MYVCMYMCMCMLSSCHFHAGSGKTAAGYWGDYNCDVPNRTIANLFENLGKMQDQFDWIYWTGDLTAHNIWNQTRATTVSGCVILY